jgi:hypothetical protein
MDTKAWAGMGHVFTGDYRECCDRVGAARIMALALTRLRMDCTEGAPA